MKQQKNLFDVKHANAQLHKNKIIKQIQNYSNYFLK